jgi:hypothetical protein
MRPFFDREPGYDLDQTPKGGRAGGGETLEAAIAVALGPKRTRQVIQRRSPVVHLDGFAGRQPARRARAKAEIRRPLVRDERCVQCGHAVVVAGCCRGRMLVEWHGFALLAI